MSSFVVTFRARWDKYSPNHQGYPIYLKTKIKGQKPTWENTAIYVTHRKQWDDKRKEVKNHPEASLMNISLTNKQSLIVKRLLNDVAAEKPLTRQAIKGKSISSFYAYCESVVRNRKKCNCEVNRIKKYLKQREPSIHELNQEWMREYQTHQKEVWKSAKETIKGSFKFLRKVLNRAYAEGYIPTRVIGKGFFEVPEGGSKKPVFLPKEPREAMLDLLLGDEILNASLYKTLAYFMLGCYSGLRFSDLRKFDIDRHIIKDSVVGDMLILDTTKTDDMVYYPCGATLTKILNIIRKIGPLKQDYKQYNNVNLKALMQHDKLKKYFKTIKLTTHVARHSFGRYQAEIGTTLADCAYYMGISVSTCEIYYHISGKIRTDRNAHLWAA